MYTFLYSQQRKGEFFCEKCLFFIFRLLTSESLSIFAVEKRYAHYLEIGLSHTPVIGVSHTPTIGVSQTDFEVI